LHFPALCVIYFSMNEEVLYSVLRTRFGKAPPKSAAFGECNNILEQLAKHRSCRSFRPVGVESDLILTLCAVALSSPTKSDLQQRDIVIVQDPILRRNLESLMPNLYWLSDAPALLIFCGNNRRQRRLHELRGHEFANDHLDAFFNAATDAAIALAWFVAAAESVGLGCCPISAIRNQPEVACRLLGLPQHVFPFAGLAVGWPTQAGIINTRLPLAATVHIDRFDDTSLQAHVLDTDERRHIQKPFDRQRLASTLGEIVNYSWSEDITRQYSQPERQGFGDYVRSKGFKLE
jgi:nitroreductase